MMNINFKKILNFSESDSPIFDKKSSWLRSLSANSLTNPLCQQNRQSTKLVRNPVSKVKPSVVRLNSTGEDIDLCASDNPHADINANRVKGAHNIDHMGYHNAQLSSMAATFQFHSPFIQQQQYVKNYHILSNNQRLPNFVSPYRYSIPSYYYIPQSRIYEDQTMTSNHKSSSNSSKSNIHRVMSLSEIGMSGMLTSKGDPWGREAQSDLPGLCSNISNLSLTNDSCSGHTIAPTNCIRENHGMFPKLLSEEQDVNMSLCKENGTVHFRITASEYIDKAIKLAFKASKMDSMKTVQCCNGHVQVKAGLKDCDEREDSHVSVNVCVSRERDISGIAGKAESLCEKCDNSSGCEKCNGASNTDKQPAASIKVDLIIEDDKATDHAQASGEITEKTPVPRKKRRCRPSSKKRQRRKQQCNKKNPHRQHQPLQKKQKTESSSSSSSFETKSKDKTCTKAAKEQQNFTSIAYIMGIDGFSEDEEEADDFVIEFDETDSGMSFNVHTYSSPKSFQASPGQMDTSSDTEFSDDELSSSPCQDYLDFFDECDLDPFNPFRIDCVTKSTSCSVPETFGDSSECDERSQLLKSINAEWNITCNIQHNPPRKHKKVHFAEAPKVHPMIAWSFAYQAARKGPWTQYACDRERFRMRIKETESKIAHCLEPSHREAIFKKYIDV